MFGLGFTEIVVLILLVVVLGVLITIRGYLSGPGSSRIAELEAENRRLREELDRLRGG